MTLIIILLLFIITIIIFSHFNTNTVNTFQNNNIILSEKDQIYRFILFKVNQVFKQLNIVYFLTSGTLLGYFREGNFIQHDYDIDVGIFANDFTFDIFTVMEKAGFYNYRNLGTIDKGYEMSFYLPNTSIGKLAKIDIFLHYPEKINGTDKLYWISYKAPLFIEKIKYRVSSFKLKKVQFHGLDVYIPQNTIRYLTEHYGPYWNFPISRQDGYSYSSSPYSIVRNSEEF